MAANYRLPGANHCLLRPNYRLPAANDRGCRQKILLGRFGEGEYQLISVKKKHEENKHVMSFPEIKKQPLEEKVVINQTKNEVKKNQDAFSSLMDELDF